MDKEFKEMCMQKRTKEIQPSAVEISNPIEMGNLAKSHKRLSEYFFDGAKSIIDCASPLLAILLGYFAMEQKTYEILALKGFKVTSHVCAIKGLSRIIERKDLAAILSRSYENRLEVNYLGNIKTVELDKERAKRFIDESALPFIAEADKIILKLQNER